MSKSKRVILFLIILVFVYSLVGCGNNNELKKIYDDNKKIASQGDSYSFLNRVGVTEDNTLNLKYSKFYGAETIWIIDIEKKGDIKIDYDSNIETGMFKVVLIDPAEQVVNIFEHKKEEANQQGSYTTIGNIGTYRLKILGDNANGEMKMTIGLSSGMKLINSSK